MRLLILSPFVPWPLDHGGKIRVFHLLRESARRHRVTLACLTTVRAPELGELPELCEEVIVERRPAKPAAGLARFLFTGASFNCARYESRRMQRRLSDLAARRTFDELRVELTMMWPYASQIPCRRTVLDVHNVESNLVHQLADCTSNPLRRFGYRVEERRLRRFERRAWEACATCVAVSESERSWIAERVTRPAKVIAVPNGVDLEGFEPRPAAAAADSVLVLGGLDYLPNLDAADWFLDDILPRLRARSPAARIRVAGRGAGRLASGRRLSGVELDGAVADVRRLLAESAVLVVPLRLGSGTRIKILEAMAAGVPVVCTSRAAEGLEVDSGIHLLIADSAAGLASAASDLLADGERAASLATAARRLVERRYSWRDLAAELERAARVAAAPAAALRPT